jgi:hypothetical protein
MTGGGEFRVYVRSLLWAELYICALACCESESGPGTWHTSNSRCPHPDSARGYAITVVDVCTLRPRQAASQLSAELLELGGGARWGSLFPVL